MDLSTVPLVTSYDEMWMWVLLAMVLLLLVSFFGV